MARGEPLAVGTPVCLWSHFLGEWIGGFSVLEVLDDGYRLQRRSDGAATEEVFGFDEVMSDRRLRPR